MEIAGRSTENSLDEKPINRLWCETMKSPFELVTEMIGSQAKIGALVGVRQSTVSYWAKTGIPAEKAIELEEATEGRVPRWLSRPDLWSAPAPQSAASDLSQVSPFRSAPESPECVQASGASETAQAVGDAA